MLTRLAASQQAGREERTRSGGWNPQALLLEVLLVLLARHVAHVGLGGAGLGLRDLAGTRRRRRVARRHGPGVGRHDGFLEQVRPRLLEVREERLLVGRVQPRLVLALALAGPQRHRVVRVLDADPDGHELELRLGLGGPLVLLGLLGAPHRPTLLAALTVESVAHLAVATIVATRAVAWLLTGLLAAALLPVLAALSVALLPARPLGPVLVHPILC